jgi:dipeptidyl aminopeptidase/acylaminoacyl peptidase
MMSALLLGCALSATAPTAHRPLALQDLLALKDVAEPRISPDGDWVAYSVRAIDADDDGSNTDIYMAPLAGGDAVQLTTGKKSESSPRWSPDGRFLAFLSEREGEKTQVYLLDRRGGEASKLTDYKASVSDLAWSSDGRRLALVVADADPEEAAAQAKPGEAKAEKKPRPIVIRRLQFVRDEEGYLREQRSHLYVFDLATRASVQVTSGPFDDSEPVWSPDGRSLAFTSNRSLPDPDASQNSDVFIVAAEAGATPRLLTTSPGADSSPSFSPDGREVAYVAGGDPKDLWYGTSSVAIVPVAGGAARSLTSTLDRNVLAPRFSVDGRRVLFIVEDGGNKHLASVALAGGAATRIVSGERDVQEFDVGSRGAVVVLETQPDHPPEVSLVGPRGLERVTHVNDALLAGVRLARVERFKARSADGTMLDAFLTRPPDAPPGVRLPTVLRIHGGPVDQFSTEFNFEWQFLAAHGYAVVAANPRGSSGYGRAFARAIWADWGNKDYEDVIAAVDHAIGQGIADPDRLGVHGWSYGGILTNYVITKTTRFKAAISGASETNYLANYGTDHYQHAWETELGLPWRNTELWLKLSPWFHVEKITTPTLLLCGEEDRNVPLLNSEQLYQALRRLGRETELVIYPGEHHTLKRPSFRKDRFERYLAWYDRYLKTPAASTAQ